MFYLFILSLIFLYLVYLHLYLYILKPKTKNIKSFDHIDEFDFKLVNIEIYNNDNNFKKEENEKEENEKEENEEEENEEGENEEEENEKENIIDSLNSHILETEINKFFYKTTYDENVNIDKLVKNIKYDFYIVNYEYNDKLYKYLDTNSNIKFPIYTKAQINNYIYINEIKSVILINNQGSAEETIILTDEIKEFLGPNYNFYKDLDIKIQFKELNYIYNFVKELKNWKLTMKDNFNNTYIVNEQNDYLFWNPNLTL